MINNSTKIVISMLILSVLYCTSACYGFASAIDEFEVSSSSQGKGLYRVFPNGVTRIESEDFLMYVRPVNSVFTGYTTYLLGLPVGKKINDNLGFSKYYYPKDKTLNSKPDYFYVEIVIVAKKNGYSFNPMQVYMNEDNEQYSAIRYVMPEGELRENYPTNDFVNLLFINKDDGMSWFSVTKENGKEKDISLPVKEKTGFGVRFNVSPPTPGDYFEIKIEGLKYDNEQVNIPTIIYDKKKVFERALY